MRNQTTQVYEELKRRITNGILQPSESLTELSLAGELNVSRGTVKNALLKLESENLVEMLPNKRAKVRSYSIAEVLQQLQVRELLEGLIARLSVPLLGDSDITELRGILSEMDECHKAQDYLRYSQCNWRFHEVLYRICPNRAAVEITMDIKNQLKRYNIRTILVRGRDKDSLREHEEILEALAARDAVRADELMRLHIANVSAVLKDNFALLF